MSSNKRYNAKRDKNEPEIVKALTRIGCSVERINEKGVPDLLVGRGGRTFLLEVKDGESSTNKQQDEFFASWKGDTALVVRSPEEAIEAVSGRFRSMQEQYEQWMADEKYKQWMADEK